MKVIHIVPRWLAPTMSWLYSIVVNSRIENLVLTYINDSTMQFSYEKVYIIHKNIITKGIKFITSKDYFVNKFLRNSRPSIVHCHFGYTGTFIKRGAYKLVVSFYGYDITLGEQSKKWSKRYNRMFEYVDFILCEGPKSAERVIRLGADRSKVKIQPIGINVELFKFYKREPSHKKLKFFIYSTFREKKGIPLALEAISEFCKRYNYDFYIGIIGDAENSSYEEVKEKKKILKKIDDLQMNEKVKLYGFVDYKKVVRISHDYDLLIHPSKFASNGDSEGGAPIGLIEMALTGMPVVTTDHCDIPYVLSNYMRPFLAKENDLNSLIMSIKKVVNSDWLIMGKKNREHIKKQHALKKTNMDLFNIYQNLA